MGDYHKKEENRENKVGKRSRIQARHLVSATV